MLHDRAAPLQAPLVTTPVEDTREQTVFFNAIIGHLSGLLEEVIGLKEAEGFISTVGGALGEEMSQRYPAVPDTATPDHIASILVDLKARIKGDFSVISADEEEIVFVARQCPFGEQVVGRPSLCMMTTNVFGRIVADRNGYAHVKIDRSIARGDPGCRVVVALKLQDMAPSDGLEFFTE